MEQELKQLIEKNLPAQVGQVLQERLLKADRDAAEVERLKMQLDGEVKEKVDLQVRLLHQDEVLQLEKDTKERLDDIKERERELDLERLKYQLEVEKEKSEFAKNVALGLVRNTEYRNTVNRSGFIPVPSGQYGVLNQSFNETTDTITENK